MSCYTDSGMRSNTTKNQKCCIAQSCKHRIQPNSANIAKTRIRIPWNIQAAFARHRFCNIPIFTSHDTLGFPWNYVQQSCDVGQVARFVIHFCYLHEQNGQFYSDTDESVLKYPLKLSHTKLPDTLRIRCVSTLNFIGYMKTNSISGIKLHHFSMKTVSCKHRLISNTSIEVFKSI